MRPRTRLTGILALAAVGVLCLWQLRWLRAQAEQPASPTLTGDARHPAQTSGWVDTRLYFGLAPEGDTRRESSDEQWQQFLDREVTPRFPAGLSVIDVNGQWQGANQPKPVHVRTKLLVIDYPNTPENAAKVEAIRSAWKQRTHDQSVLKVTEPAEVSF